ncbi:MAG: deoxyribonuclease IV [Peptostreptococcales bacterium]|jgi:deoxyribonuclease-4
MLNIGCHLSISKGYYHAGMEALSIGANTFQFFTRNPRGGSAKAIDMKDIEKLRELAKENEFAPLFAHASYTMNLCSEKEETRLFAKEILKDDLKRISLLPKCYYILHPGSRGKQDIEVGIKHIAEALNEAIAENNDVIILLEGMSGKGTEVGGTMEELHAIIDAVSPNEGLGIILDTCHLYSAGFDIVHDLDGVIQYVDKTVGWERVKGIHLNDSKVPFASHKDRHEVIGKGTIGIEALKNIINHTQLRKLPFNLETPNELEGYKKEIELLKSLYIEI